MHYVLDCLDFVECLDFIIDILAKRNIILYIFCVAFRKFVILMQLIFISGYLSLQIANNPIDLFLSQFALAVCGSLVKFIIDFRHS